MARRHVRDRPADDRPQIAWDRRRPSVAAFRDGVMARWRSNTNPALGTVPCYTNHWPDTAAESDVFFSSHDLGSDPRYVTLLVTREYPPGPGRELIPVKYLAGFYITGWTPHRTQAPACPDNDPDPGGSTDFEHAGYFVNFVSPITPDVTPGDPLCAFGTEPETCVAVLVE